MNEFEAELEAGDKWKRRFRLQRERASDSEASADEAAPTFDEDEEALLDVDETADEAGPAADSTADGGAMSAPDRAPGTDGEAPRAWGQVGRKPDPLGGESDRSGRGSETRSQRRDHRDERDSDMA